MKKILVPCDFSKCAVSAFYSAISISSLRESEIHLLHVIDLPVMHDAVLMPAFNYKEESLSNLRQGAEKRFRRLIEGTDTGELDIHFHISYGPIALCLLNFIREEDIDLVIMGTNGTSGLSELLVGSNTEKIVRSSIAPVLTLRSKVDINQVKKIVLPAPTDFDDEAELISQVKALQAVLQASLHIVWVNTPSNFRSDSDIRNKLVELARRYSLSNYTISIYNELYEESGIIKFAHDIEADLIAMGTHGRKGLAHVFGGSVTEDVVNHIDLPVWTFSMHKVQERISTSIL